MNISFPKRVAFFLGLIAGLVAIATVIGMIAGIPAGIIDEMRGCPDGYWVVGWTHWPDIILTWPWELPSNAFGWTANAFSGCGP